MSAPRRPARARIALLGPAWPLRGGIAHHTSLLARHLRRRADVCFVSFARGYPRCLYPGRTDRDPSAIALRESSEPLLAPLRPWTWWAAARRIAGHRPDLVVVQWWSPFWAPSLATVAALAHRWSRARVAFVCHNVLPHEGATASSRALTRLALARGQVYIVHSDADAATLRRILPGVRRAPERIHRAVLPALSIGAPIDRPAARDRLGLPATVPVALFFGFVRPYKGLSVLIDAMPLASLRLPGLQLVVAGECWGSPEVYRRRALARGVADRVRFDDRYIPDEDVGAYFAAADVVVLPYVEASQSGVVTQAAAAGVPCIVTRVGGLPESVKDGVSGLVVPPSDAGALADALVRVLGDAALAARLREGVIATRARFGWDALCDVLEDLALGAPGGATGAAPERCGARER